MDKLTRWIKFNLSYFGAPPWDTGISPPELIEFINHHPPGKALDLGCGTGTNVATLAEAGWKVIGVDFGFLAVLAAKYKLRKYLNSVRIKYGNVTDIKIINGLYNLVLDIGCFHSLPPDEQDRYISNLNQVLYPGGYLLMYAHLSKELENVSSGISNTTINKIGDILELKDRIDSKDRKDRPATWLTFQMAKV